MKPVFTSSITNKKYVVINHSSKPLCCHSDNIIYLITCTKCGVQYVGETKNKLHIRMNSHRVSLRAKAHTLLYEHFNGNCNIDHMHVQPIDQSLGLEDRTARRRRELFWMKELRTIAPYGLNDRVYGKNWRLRSRDDVAGMYFNYKRTHRGKRAKRSKDPKPSSNWRHDFLQILALL